MTCINVLPGTQRAGERVRGHFALVLKGVRAQLIIFDLFVLNLNQSDLTYIELV